MTMILTILGAIALSWELTKLLVRLDGGRA